MTENSNCTVECKNESYIAYHQFGFQESPFGKLEKTGKAIEIEWGKKLKNTEKKIIKGKI